MNKMQKTRLGVSVGILGAVLYLGTYFSGWIALLLLGGYILLFEENPWLKRCAVKAAALLLTFELVINVIEIIPEIMNICFYFMQIFNKIIRYEKLTIIVDFVKSTLQIIEKILFVLLGIKAIHQGTVRIPIVDSLVDKYMDRPQQD